MTKKTKKTSAGAAKPKVEPKPTRPRRKPSSMNHSSDAPPAPAPSNQLPPRSKHDPEVIHDGDGIPLLAPGGLGGGGGTERPPISAAADDVLPNERLGTDVGYKNPPREHQFKKGQSGNPSGRSKKPRLPKHLGNQTNAISLELLGELNSIMMHGMPSEVPTGHFAGAKLLARVMFRDAMTKDGGYARKRLVGLYYDEKRDLEEFRAKDRRELEADQMREQIQMMMNPNTTDEDMERAIKRWGEELDGI